MPPKQPACDPCRASKLACDHGQPTCLRCQQADRSSECRYRNEPFKKRKRQTAVEAAENVSELQQTSTQDSSPHVNIEGIVTNAHKYPNPGWLGTFSHQALFDHIPIRECDTSPSIASEGNSLAIPSEGVATMTNMSHGAKLVDQMQRLLSLPSCYSMLRQWSAQETNLALAGSFVDQCAETVRFLLPEDPESSVDNLETAKLLFANSGCQLITDPADTPENYVSQFCQKNARWETLGLFCTAVSRATIDVMNAQGSYKTSMRYRGLSRLAMQFSDAFLEIAVSLDCLNDLQLFLQYENFILHSMVDGDQSYNSWKRLGDVIGALFALGYHQQNEAEPAVAPFIIDLRRAVFARVYSADKNVSIFLGRPPRISRKYCRFYLPGHPIEITGSSLFQIPQWDQDVGYTYHFETQWTLLCAALKEDVLDLSNSKYGTDNGHRAEDIQRLAEALWEALPTKFKLRGPLKQGNQSPVITDFLVSARLNYMHISFLLRLVLTRGKAQFDTTLSIISAEMLGIVVDAIMLRHRLSNSGTSLVWKVAYYGLAAAGALCLWLLNESAETRNSGISRSKVFQHLSVLVAEVEAGTLVEVDDSNYKLLMSASQTISNLLDQILHGTIGRQRRAGDVFEPSLLAGIRNQTEWSPWDNAGLQEFESDFWINLAGHPSLIGVENLVDNGSQPASL